MNFFLIFIFLNTMLYFDMPNIDDNNYVLHKIIFFISLFYFYFLISSLSKIFRKCSIGIKELIGRSAIIAVSGVLGYSLFVDLSRSRQLSEYFNEVLKLDNHKNRLNLLVSMFILMFIVFVRCIELLISYNDMGCQI
jgi:hypothetical protein